ncbi:hypothetical protein KI688_007688 [Linnemannia hyalina]|uniref:RNI-like protein n=1 Tax=Linnemannia hyalina TaxID=64524 RepID=A0A9P8BLY5_9FUNG|nr:hypothetical protein KI688_007688 [Linnemannia hyalina]
MSVITPLCIKHYPDVVLDVVLASVAKHVLDDSPMATPRLTHTDSRAENPPNAPINPCHPGATINELNVSPSASLTARLDESVSGLTIATKPLTDLSSAEPCQTTMTRASTTYIQSQLSSITTAVELARQSGKPLTSEALLSMIASKFTLALTAKSSFEGTVMHKLDGLYDQGAMTQQIAQEVLKLQKQMKDRLILIQSKTEAILTQQLELTEYPIPRLFIVLPEEPAKYDPGNWFRTKFRLHFICECGKHTEANNSKEPHHLHLAKHGGYLIREPTELFKKYGPFLLLMLELIKFGTSIAGHVVPTLASLKVVELADSVQQSIESVTAKIDYSLECIDNQLSKVQASSPGDFISTEPRAAMTQQDLTDFLSDVEGLEGVELRQLGSFLKTSEDENLLGNLYRMATSDGHVKWVCHDHYRASYQEKYTQKLRDVVKLAEGELYEQLGRVEIVLTSKFAAAEFYNALSKAKGVLELIMDLSWDCTRSDLDELEDALKTSRVSVLRLDLRRFRISLGNRLLSTSAQYEALFRLRELPTVKITHIILPKEFIKFLSVQPKTSSHLCKLSFELSPGSIGGKEFERLAEALKTNSTLTTLDLQHNSIGDNGAQALSEALKVNSTLTTLDLQHNSIEDNGAQALSEALKTNSTLTTLDLRSNSIWFKGFLPFSEGLKTNSTLTTLDLRDNLIGDNVAQALSEALKTNSTLTTLDLQHNSIGPDGAQALSEALKINSTLTTLNLRSNSIWFKGFLTFSEGLKTNSTLTTLDLRGNLIGDNVARALSEALKTNSTLTTLDLQHNSIGPDGAQALSEALKTNSTLATLDLQHNSIGPDGAQALSKALKTNSTLTTLNLYYNGIGDYGARALSEALKTNSTLTTLALWRNSIGPDGAQALSEALKTNSTLTTLNLMRNPIKDNGAQALSEALKTNSTLTTLDLSNNSIAPDGAQALSEALKTNSTLTVLNLSNNSLGPDGAQALSKALKTNPTLTTLDLSNNSIGPDGAQVLSEALETNSTLTTLNLYYNGIGDDGARALSEALKTNSTLTTLDLWRNSIGPDGAQALSEALKTNSTLTTLNLMRNSIKDNGTQALSEALKTNSILTILYLSNNSIGPAGAQALVETLKTNSTLTTLDLQHNSIGPDGTRLLSEAIKRNSVVR